MIRRSLALATILAMVAAAAPATILAQDQLSLGSISGRAIDAAGRGVGAAQIELVQGAQVVSVSKTNAVGEWSFRDVKPGEYAVRVMLNGRLTGVRVTVAGGRVTSGMFIVVSTASVSPQLGTLASLLTLVPTAATAVAAASVSVVTETDTVELNEAILTAILEELTPAERLAFATAVLEAIEENTEGSSPFEQYTKQFEEIQNTGGNTVPVFPPPSAAS